MSQTAFEKAFDRVLRLEGGYVNHENDPGGATCYGITQAVYNDWSCSHGLRPEPVALIKEEEAQQIYEERYWKRMQCDEVSEIDEAVAIELFEAGVNCGCATAVRFLQEALNVLRLAEEFDIVVDGILGPVTLSVLQRSIDRGWGSPLLIAMNGEQYEHYKFLVTQAGDHYRSFARGWMKRVTLRSAEA